MDQFKIYYTTAPSSYDGFGTETIEMAGYTDSRGKELRKVKIPESAINWQTSRYNSGNHGAFTEEEFQQYNQQQTSMFKKMAENNTNKEIVASEIATEKNASPITEIAIQNPEIKNNQYIPQSEACISVDTVVPSAMRYDMLKAIETIDRRVNGVDEYVAEKLGYIPKNCSLEERKLGLQSLCKALSAEQVDAVAVAIYNIEQKKQGVIIGDQTGIGKGRIAAAMIRYGVFNGHKPIFITEKPNLFSDLFRDIVNIGSDDGIPVEILDGYKQVAKKVVKITSEEEESDTEEEEEEDEVEFVNQPIYKKNKNYPKYTYTEIDIEGKEQVVTKEGRIFMKPFIVNGEGSAVKTHIKDEQGNILYKGSNQEVKNIIGFVERTKTGQLDAKGKEIVEKQPKRGAFTLSKDYSFILATYSQFSGDPEKMTLKMRFLLEMAQDNIVIMDESHNASGASNTGAFLRNVLENSKGVTFLSATFAKRPDNMPIYASKTSIQEANMTNDELVASIESGGVALQEIIASSLVSEGQMIRRERSFEGIETNYEYLDASQDERGFPNLNMEEKHKAIMDRSTEIIRDIMAFQKDFVNPEIEEMDDIMKASLGEVSARKGTEQAGIDNQPVFSGVFNAINQLLFSIKAEAVGMQAVQRLKEGKKPVIAFANTMESFLNFMTNDDGTPVSDGDIVNSDFSKILERRLDSVLRYTITYPDGTKDYKMLDLSKLSAELNNEYKRILGKIKSTSIGICSSPIDALVDVIEKAGFSTIEVTGRKRQLKLLGNDTAMIKSRTKVGANDAFRMFNNNEVDCLLINQSGSTGASAHAIVTKKVPKEQVKQRVMIILQAELNINTEVQKRGRINRTGQILKPIYDYVISAIPAEKRLMMMLQKKLKSLDANTTSSQKQAVESPSNVQADFLNKYGDDLVVEYLKENPLINEILDDPLKIKNLTDSENKNKIEDAAHKVSGRVAILSVKDQENFYREMSQRYLSLVEYLKQTGEYDLEVTSMNLQAETIEREIAVVGSGGESVFARNSILEKCLVNNLKKPYKSSEVMAMIEDSLNGSTPEQHQRHLREKYDLFVTSHLISEKADIDAYYDDLIANIPKEKAAAKADNLNEYIRYRESNLNEARQKEIERSETAAKNRKAIISNLFSFFTIGKIVGYPSISYDNDATWSKAIFIGFVINEDLKNPYAPSAIKLRFAIASSQRYIALPASKTNIVDAIQTLTYRNIYDRDYEQFLKGWDEMIAEKSSDRTTRYIVTGNIMQAFGNENLKGTLISYTTIDGGLKKGILLPEYFSKLGTGSKGKPLKIKVPIIKALPLIKNMNDGSTMETSDNLSILRLYSEYRLNTPITKQKGEKFFQDQLLKDMSKEGTFNKTSDRMYASYEPYKIDNIVEYLQNKFNLSVMLEQYQFEQIKDSIEDTIYDDEQKVGEDIVIEKLTERDRLDEQEKNKETEKTIIDEQEAEKQRQEDEKQRLENENKILKVKSKIFQLIKLLSIHEIKMAKGGVIDEKLQGTLKKKAYEIGISESKANGPRAVVQNTTFQKFLKENEQTMSNVDLMKAFNDGYTFQTLKSAKEKFFN